MLDWSLVVHWSEEMLANGHDHNFFEEAISHHKLLCGARDVSVVVKNSHCGEAGDMGLQNDVRTQINVDYCLLRGEGSDGLGCTKVIEPFVPDFVDHYSIISK